MADSLSKAIDFIINIINIIINIIISILIINYIFPDDYIKASTVFKLSGIFLIICLLIYLPGKVFEKKANECYEELNKNHDN
jgi:hypothetical protein